MNFQKDMSSDLTGKRQYSIKDLADVTIYGLNETTGLPGVANGSVKSHIQHLATKVGASLYKGVIDCSANPNYPAMNPGEYYVVSVAGKIGGASGIRVEVGDQIYCRLVSVAGTHAAVGANYYIAEKNFYIGLWTDLVPVTRTKGQLVADESITLMANIDLIDAAIGADSELTVVTRTLGQLALNTSLYLMIDDLDAAIGADAELVPVTRTVGQLAVNTSIYAMFDLIDTVVGADASLTPSARTTGPVAVANDIYTNIDALDAAIGIDVVPTVRTVGPLVAANTVAGNLTALDTAIGTDAQLTPVARTTGPIAAANSTAQNLGALDDAIGIDLVPMVRTNNPTIAANAVIANISALDSAIGFDAQFAGTPITIAVANSVYQNLDSLDATRTVRTIKKTVGWHGAAGTDFVFATAADHVAQNLDLGAIVPAKARVMAIEVVCTEAVVGVTDFNVAVGNASAGAQFIAAISCDDANEVAGIIDATKPAAVVMNWAAATNIWLQGDPSDNTWANMSAGKWTVYVTFNQLTNV